MITKISVGKKNEKYDVLIGKEICSKNNLQKFITKEQKILLLLDKNVPNKKIVFIKKQLNSLGLKIYNYEITPGEQSKSFRNFEKILNFLSKNSFLRSDGIVACGGGVTGDLGGFVASTYMRGISFIQVPTTLLSQVDSSVGGKTAINLPSGKNLVGSFYNPKGVLIDTNFLDSLGEREYKSGLAEIIKHALIADRAFANFLLKHSEKILKRDSSYLRQIITKSLNIKAKIVTTDHKEQGIRAFLNFGHTIGHALEHAFKSKLLHGEAVAYGMDYETKISLETLNLCKDDYSFVQEILKAYGFKRKLNVTFEKLRPFIKIDKKNSADSVNLVQLNKIGSCEIVPIKNINSLKKFF
ncbi:MAG: 3-dehydroquinate synthase [Gammaproteobacteria bacterium]|jgi:3-dehydroquinate synthase